MWCTTSRQPPGSSVCSKPHRLVPPDRLKAAEVEFDLLFKEGNILLSKNLWALLSHIVLKQDRRLQPCSDYRAVNHQPPHIDDFSHLFHSKNIHSKIDLVQVYKQILVASSDIEKTVIIFWFTKHSPKMPTIHRQYIM